MVAATTVFMASKMKKNENRLAEQNEIKNEAAEEKAEFAGAANWWNSMRSNQITHSIDINDIIESRQMADNNLSKADRALGLTWEEMGPDNVGGRARALLFDNANSNHIIAGGVSGGLWESQNLGQSWNRIIGFNDASIWNNQNISCIAQTANGDIYVGTGEYFGFFETSVVGGGTGFPGDGIWKSSDHGSSWIHVKTSGSTNPSVALQWSFVTSLATGDPVYPNRIYATVKGSGANSGLVYSDNGGTTWLNCTGTAISTIGKSVAVGSNGIVHVVVGGKYMRSTNGTSFDNVGVTGLPTSSSRMAVAVSPTDPNYVYVIAAYSTTSGDLLKGVYKSVDAGLTFVQIGPTQTDNNSVNWSPVTQGTYALALAVSPANPNVVFIGGIDCFKYDLQSNGTYAWKRISKWNYAPWSSLYSHADIHTFVFHPSNPDIMFIGSDGGFSMTTNSSAVQPAFGTRNLGFNCTQFYSFDVRENSGIFVAGAQDNGNFRVDYTGNTTKTGVEIKGGDGGDVQVSKVNPNAIFAEYVNGSVERSLNNGQSFSDFFDAHIDNVDEEPGGNKYPDEGAAFIAPILLHEDVANSSNLNQYSKFFLGTFNGVWMTQQAMNFSVVPAWYKVGTGISGVAISLAITPDGKSVFAGTENGRLYRIDGLDTTYAYDTLNHFFPSNVGITTTLIHTFTGRFITGISVDKINGDHVVVALGNYGNTDYVYESTDATSAAAFTNITGNLPKMPVYCSAIDPTNANTIVIGTELGIWASENGGTTWVEENNTMARVPVTKLRQLPVGNYLNALYASTYGNGVWRTFSNSAVSTEEPKSNSNEGFKIFPNPTSNEINFLTNLSWGSTNVQASLYDVNGRLVKTINYGKLPVGVFALKMNISDVANGNYLIQVISGSNQSVSKVIVAH